MLTVVKDACDTFIAGSSEFWLLAGATDVSFETGSNARYRHQIEIMRECGCPVLVADQLLQGVNGNISRIIETRHPELGPFRSNSGRNGRLRPDVWFGRPGSAAETIVEIKALYEMTTSKFFGAEGTHCVADDRRKLNAIRGQESDFRGTLFQIVFFLELPNYSYPAGRSLHLRGWQDSDSRDSYRWFGTIAAQYAELRKHLPPPSFPAIDTPEIRPLSPPTPKISCVLQRWCEKTFQPAEQWCFAPAQHLSGVRVGYAIWQC